MASNKAEFENANAIVVIVAKDTQKTVRDHLNVDRNGYDLKGIFGIGEPDHEIGALYAQEADQYDYLLPAQFIIGQDGLIKYVNYAGEAVDWAPPGDLLSELAELQ